MRKMTKIQSILGLTLLLFLGMWSTTEAQTKKSYFPMGGVTRNSNGTFYFARSGRNYVTPGEVVTKSGEVTNCQTNGKKCAQLLSEAARESIEMDGLQMEEASSLTGSAPVLELVKEHNEALVELGETKSGIYFLDYRTGEWQVMKFFKESHTRVMKSLRRKG